MTLKDVVLLTLAIACFASASFADGPPDQGAPLSAREPLVKPSQPSEIPVSFFAPADFNREIYYRNKLEVSLETGALPYNTPLILEPILGEKFHREHGLPNYTLVPTFLMLRWHLYDPRGPSFLRGNTDFSFGGVYTAIPKGPESVFAGPMIGMRYNFVQPNWRVVPYLELRGGLGYTDAKGPWEVKHHKPDIGQGQDFTFTFLMGAGARYNFTPRYSASLGVSFMHISNAYLSEPKYWNHGVNVVGGLVGLNVGLNDLFHASK